MRRLLLALVLGLSLTAIPAVAATPGPGAAGVGDRYFPTDGNGGYDVRHYRVRIRYAFDTGRLTGRTRISATARRALSRFNLDLLLEPTRVVVNGARARFTRPTPHELQVTPRRTLRAGRPFVVRVHYGGRPGTIAWQEESPWLANRREVLAVGEPHIAPWWFAANDHPRDKARFDLRVTVPRGRQVVANGTLVGRRVGARTVTWHWRARDPMATYLAFFSAGRFSVRRGSADGLPWTAAVSRQLTRRQQTRAHALLARTPEVVAWLESRLGDYPFETTGGLVSGLPTGFALENQTRPTYPYVGGRSEVWLVVHEIAHQWFGDHVSVRSWRDIWLNEGFATFLTVLWDEAHGGPAGQRWLLDTWASYPATDDFWKLRIGNPGRGRLFDWEVYERGAMAVQALRHRVGEETFWRVLDTWLARHAGGSGSVAGFRRVAARVSGQNLSGFFDSWLFTPKRPARTEANGLR